MGRDQYHRGRENRPPADSQAEIGSRRRNCGISAEQNRVLMRILPLTNATQAKILSSRRDSSRSAERVAARIVADVRRRGDPALFSWTKRFDRVVLSAKTVWVSRAELAKATETVSPEFL